MKTHPTDLWQPLRAAYRPQVPELNVPAIMDAVRREASAHPWQRAGANPVAAIPTWACATAAALAILAAASVVGQSVTDADQQIGHAWLRTVQPAQFEKNFMDFSDFSL
jgi:hypothetical protein